MLRAPLIPHQPEPKQLLWDAINWARAWQRQRLKACLNDRDVCRSFVTKFTIKYVLCLSVGPSVDFSLHSANKGLVVLFDGQSNAVFIEARCEHGAACVRFVLSGE
jgi:hypothetical protein